MHHLSHVEVKHPLCNAVIWPRSVLSELSSARVSPPLLTNCGSPQLTLCNQQLGELRAEPPTDNGNQEDNVWHTDLS